MEALSLQQQKMMAMNEQWLENAESDNDRPNCKTCKRYANTTWSIIFQVLHFHGLAFLVAHITLHKPTYCIIHIFNIRTIVCKPYDSMTLNNL